MALGAEVVNLIGLHLLDDPLQVAAIGEMPLDLLQSLRSLWPAQGAVYLGTLQLWKLVFYSMRGY